jgi:pyruvate/2-oxoglutarate dehydrogenase complex dihydrolipoamide dehydrogenase (E3) component
MTGERFDAIVIGAGPAGEVVASRLGEHGMATALVEQELVGGECAYWACIPSKTLLRPGEARRDAERSPGTWGAQTRWGDVAEYRDYMIRNLDDEDEVEGYEEQGIRVFKGRASLQGPGTVRVGRKTIRGDRLVIATGSQADIPAIEGLAAAGYWTNREATTLIQVPESAIVLGGGPVGIELAQMLRRFGAEVDLFEASGSLLEREDPRVGELILAALHDDGIRVHLGTAIAAVSREGDLRVAHHAEGQVRARQVIVAVGRKPRVEGLTLESVGIEPTPTGIRVDERCRAADGVWAVGDVTGEMPFTHVAMYQGRIAVADIVGQPARADYQAVPRVLFSDPEVAAVGMTEREASSAGIDVRTVHLPLRDTIARPWTYETDPRGELAVIADARRKTLVGAWAVGPLASEWIHYAALAIKAAIPLSLLRDTVAQFPTYTEAYLKAIERLDL